MPARNHVTKIRSADTVAKQDPNNQSQADFNAQNQPDPQDAQKALEGNTTGYVDGNGSGLGYTGQPTSDGAVKDSEEAAKRADAKASQEEGRENPNTQLDNEEKKAKEEGGDKPAEEGLEITHPASSKAQGGKEVKTEVKKSK
jgi:hypothetical protein